ncbi:MAG: glycosyltransferase family 4 protein [Myxococcota bacterium]
MEFHVLSFEGPDGYSRAGGIATRIVGLTEALAGTDLPTHLWFVGDPELPGHEEQEGVQLHRWCQWLSAHHPMGVYDGEETKADDYAKSLPPYLLDRLEGSLRRGERAVVLAEEWHTVHAVRHLDHLLRERRLRDRVAILWNANNTFGFDRIDWPALGAAATLTTVSRYMRQWMRERCGVDPIVVANGLGAEAFGEVDEDAVRLLRGRAAGRTLLAKMARFDPDKRWLMAVDAVRELKSRNKRPLLVARGGFEAHGHEVVGRALDNGLSVERRRLRGGTEGLVAALADTDGVDLLMLDSHVDGPAKRLLFRTMDAVLANSAHEPFGLVGLETMAVGGVACTGISGEDYVQPGSNAVVVQTDDPRELCHSVERLVENPEEARALRDEGTRTARRYAWPAIVERALLPRIQLAV